VTLNDTRRKSPENRPNGTELPSLPEIVTTWRLNVQYCVRLIFCIRANLVYVAPSIYATSKSP
jgi:hypothetical protein